MNIFQKIKLAFQLKGIVEEEIKEAKMPTASGKPGWKSSEFWWGLATQAGVLWGAVQGFIPPKWAAIVSTVGVAIYTVARTVAKAVSDVQAAKAGSTTVATTAPVTTVTTAG